MHSALRSLGNVDWDDLGDVDRVTDAVFDEITSDPRQLEAMLHQVGEDDRLMELSQSLDKLTKITLHDADGVRVRLHLFRPECIDRPHSHRSTLGVRILHGRYRHDIYGHEEDLLESKVAIRPINTRVEVTGGGYVIDDRAVHRVASQGATISLVVRGPIVKQKAVGLAENGALAHKYGAADESPEFKRSVGLTSDQLRSSIRHVDSVGLL